MKRWAAFCGSVTGLVVAFALAGCTPQGDVGIIVGAPTGLSYKWEYRESELVLGAGYNIGEDGIHAHLDWILLEGPIGATALEYYLGVGFRIS